MAVTLVKPYCLRELPCDLTCVIRKAWWPFPRRLALKPATLKMRMEVADNPLDA